MRRALPRILDQGLILRLLICGFGFGVFFIWAAFVPLDEGLAAEGTIVVDQDRKTIQHLEGGIIHQLLVDDGSVVAEGEVLLVLETTSAESDRDRLVNQIARLEGAAARLRALRDGARTPDFTALAGLSLANEVIDRIEDEQSDIFRQARLDLSTERDLLLARRETMQATALARDDQIRSIEEGLLSAEAQLTDTRRMVELRLARADEARQIEQRLASQRADLARLRSERDQARSEANELSAQARRADIEFRREALAELEDVEADLADRREAFLAADDVVTRSVIRAPQAGEVHNLNFSTIGGVIQPGEPILEIVPDSEDVIASVRILPNNRAALNEGLKVRTQIVAFTGWKVPELTGEIVDISPDLKVDQATGMAFYEARVLIPEAEIERAGGTAITPGMPIQAFVFSGKRRTLLNYLIEPITESLFLGTRQS